jgi:hypothetical protein
MTDSAAGEISDDARRKADDKARNLRVLKYRLLFIFLLLPSVLVISILFDWIAESELLAHLSRTYVMLVYAGLIVLFVIVFLILGYILRKRLRHEEEQAALAAKPIEGFPQQHPPHPTRPTDTRSHR